MIKKILIGGGIVLIFFILIVIFRKDKTFPAQGRGVSGNSGISSTAWVNPEKVEILGYDGDAIEPAISKGGRYLFFNNGYQRPKNTSIFYAEKIDDNKFRFLGEVKGVKEAGHYSMTAEIGSDNNLYFSSDRADGKTPKIYRGIFKEGEICQVVMLPGVINQKRSWDPAAFDGSAIYYTENTSILDNFDIRISTNENFVLQNINTGKMEYAPSISQDQLELFFTKADAESVLGILSGKKAKIYMATRKSVSDLFGEPEIIEAIARQNDDAFVEAPAITTDGKTLYYHKKDGKKFVIYKVTKKASIKENIISKPYERINIIGQNTEDASKGVFDPSLEHDDNGVVWMVYTAIGMENKGNAHSTDLAKSEDGGKTWQYVARINGSPKGEVTLKGKKIFGNWRNEVATLVDDKDDPDPSKRWKLFWHKYFQKAPFGERDRLAAGFGWIAYKYAASPLELAQAEEIRLFGNYPAPLDPADGETKYPVQHYLNQIDRNLEGFLAFTEPGSLVKDGRIYLTLQTVHSNVEKTQIFLISSEDHGNRWRYNGVLIDHADANNLNTPFLTASSLFEENNRTFILASPVTADGHNGILVFEFESIAEAKLKRDSSGQLIPVQRVEPFIEGEFSGCGDYDAKKTYGGIIISQVDVLKVIEKKNKEGGMQIFDTKEKIK